MSNLKKQLNEISQYPYDAYVSSRRMARMMAEVLDECSNRQQISLFVGIDNLFMRNNINLRPNEHLYLLRKARRSHSCNATENGRIRGKRWTFCWQGSAISFRENLSGAEIDYSHPLEFVLPEVECRIIRKEETIVSSGPVLDVIKALSVENRGSSYYVNTGVRTKKLQVGKPITAHFAIAVAQVSGKHADKAEHPDYCRLCDREVMQMSSFKVTFSLSEDNEVQTKISID